jgi:hypothetical protein
MTAIWSSTDFNLSLVSQSVEHLPITDRFECILVMLDNGFGTARRPAHGDDVKAGRPAEQAMLLKKPQGQVREPALFSVIHGERRPGQVFVCRGSDFDEYNDVTIGDDDVNLAVGSVMVSDQNPVTLFAEVASGTSFRTCAEPATPPGDS